jgi:hypothetical protein
MNKVKPGEAYYHGGHGSEDVEERVVPNGCAYITSVRPGQVADYSDPCDINAAKLWNRNETILKVLLGSLKPVRPVNELEPDRKILEVFVPPVAGGDSLDKMTDRNIRKKSTATVCRAGARFVDSYFLPFFAYPPNPERSPDEDVIGKPSGLIPFRVGDPSLNVSIRIPRGIITEDILRRMYGRSVFPTIEMLLATPAIPGPNRQNPDQRNYSIAELLAEPRNKLGLHGRNVNSIQEVISYSFTCSSEALMVAFPGVHCHFVCRTPAFYDISHWLSNDASRASAVEGKVKIMAGALTDAEFDKRIGPLLLQTTNLWQTIDWSGMEKPMGPPYREGRPNWTPAQLSWGLDKLQEMRAAAPAPAPAPAPVPKRKTRKNRWTRRGGTRRRRSANNKFNAQGNEL